MTGGDFNKRIFVILFRTLSKTIDPEERRLGMLVLLGKERRDLMGLELKNIDYPITFSNFFSLD